MSYLENPDRFSLKYDRAGTYFQIPALSFLYAAYQFPVSLSIVWYTVSSPFLASV